MFLQTDGTVMSAQKISSTQGSFTGTLGTSDYLGQSVASMGDLNSDGVVDLMVGAPGDDDGTTDSGAVWVLFMTTNGTVSSFQKISCEHGLFGAGLEVSDWFGWSVAKIGDLDGDGVVDTAVGALYDDDGASNAGAVYVLYLESDGTVVSYGKISAAFGSFTADLASSDGFGASVTGVGDVNSDGVLDIAVGAQSDDDGATDVGSVYVLFMNADGSVRSFDKLSATTSDELGSYLSTASDYFGASIACTGLVDSVGKVELVVGAHGDDDGGTNRGAVYVLPYQPAAMQGIWFSVQFCHHI